MRSVLMGKLSVPQVQRGGSAIMSPASSKAWIICSRTGRCRVFRATDGHGDEKLGTFAVTRNGPRQFFTKVEQRSGKMKSHQTLHVWSSKRNKLDAVAVANAAIVRPKFLPLEVINNAKTELSDPQIIDVHLASGDMVSIPRGSDMQQIAQVVAILRKE